MTVGLLSLGKNLVSGSITQQNLSIGGVGSTRGMTMVSDGTMLTWNDSTGPYKGTTTTIPGPNTVPFIPWSQVFRAANAPSAWLQAPTELLGQGCVEITTPWNDSSFMLAMICGQSGNPLTYLMKSTDSGTTWSLTNFPVNSRDANGGQPNTFSQSIAIDPNNHNIAWVTGDTNVQVTLDGGATWNTCASLGTTQQGFAMAYDPSTPNRLVIGLQGVGLKVSTNANLGTSATFSTISTSLITAGTAQFGSDGTYYCTDGSGLTGIYRLTSGNTYSHIYTDIKTSSSALAVDWNNPGRVATWSTGNGAFGNGPVVMNTTVANTGTVSWSGNGDKSMGSTPDAPYVGRAFNNTGGTGANGATTLNLTAGLWFDPWKDTSITSINLSSLSAGGATGNITLVSGGNRIAIGNQLRVTNTGTPSNYFIFNVGAYNSGTKVVSGTIISSAQGFYLGGPIGGTATASAWTITAERIYNSNGPAGGPSYVDGFVDSSTSQLVGSCLFGLESASVYDVSWPVGGNPLLAIQDKGVMPIVRNPWNAGGGVVDSYGFGDYGGSPFQSTNISNIPGTTGSFITAGFSGFLKSTTGGASNTWSAPANQPAGNTGPVSAGSSNVFIAAGGPGASSQSLYYTQNAGSSAWTIMPSPAPAANWGAGDPFLCAHVLDFDTTTSGPYVFYGVNADGGDGFCYQFSVPASGTPTVTKKGQPIPTSQSVGIGCKLRCVPNHTGHLFFTAGLVDSSAHTLASIFASHPNGASTSGNYTCLQFSSNQGGTWTPLTTTTQEVVAVGLGAPSTDSGSSGYPTIFGYGWFGGGQLGLYRCINFNPASLGSETWQLIDTYMGTYGLSVVAGLEGDPNQEGRCILGINGNGATIFQQSGKTNGWF